MGFRRGVRAGDPLIQRISNDGLRVDAGSPRIGQGWMTRRLGGYDAPAASIRIPLNRSNLEPVHSRSPIRVSQDNNRYKFKVLGKLNPSPCASKVTDNLGNSH
jgi:hypothetical protein